MALPTLAKTWQFDTNNTAYHVNDAPTNPEVHERNQRLILAVKNALVALGMSVDCSCGYNGGVSFTAGADGDGIDRWETYDKIRMGTGANGRSWTVLSSIAGWELCIAFDSSSSVIAIGQLVLSPSAGFTGGSYNARPTATDELEFCSANDVFGTSNNNLVWNLMMSDDGEELRYLCFSDGGLDTCWFIGKIQNADVTWTAPYWCHFSSVPESAGTNGGIDMDVTYNTVGGGYDAYNQAYYDGRALVLRFTCETWANDAAVRRLRKYNEIDGNWPFFPIGIASATAGGRGRHGTMADLWWGIAEGPLRTGQTFPSDGSGQFMFLGTSMITAWNGSVPVLA